MTNQLNNQSSLYLQQHAKNPVEWYSWSNEAFAHAKQLNKPVLLSIGYASCHWCHVMAHESFEDIETAKIMNELFINIKVDREERPDIDDIYQTTHQVLNMQPGGWPLTVFLCPETKSPFFSGTYFPKEAHYGRPAFKTVLKQLANFYHKNHEKIREGATTLVQQLQRISQSTIIDEIPAQIDLQNIALKNLAANFDADHGGFGGAPKFPMPNLLFNLIFPSHDDIHSSHILRFTLEKMQMGGIWDQLGFGFFRYSTDDHWEIPHFEKMLYDNAQLLSVYALGFKIFNDASFKQTAKNIITWLTTKMQSKDGAYFASIDADVEHHEGETYLWDINEIQHHLTTNEFYFLKSYFNLEKRANFEEKWHLHQAQKTDVSTSQQSTLIAARKKLLDAREKRPQPTTDEKIICSWNALTAKGLLQAGLWLKNVDFIQQGQACLDFIFKQMWINNQLYSTFQSGQAKNPAYLDDYAFLLDALMHSLTTIWRDQDFLFLQHIADKLLSDFYDQEKGGFFFTSHQHESLISRNKPLQDGVLPAGNGVAAIALLRAGHLTGKPDYLTAAHQTVKWAYNSIKDHPEYFFHLSQTLKEVNTPPTQVLITGPYEKLHQWQQHITSKQTLNQWVYYIPIDALQYPSYLTFNPDQDEVAAYICHGTHCEKPISNLNAVLATLTDLTESN